MLTQLIRTFEMPRTKALLVFWGIPTTLLLVPWALLDTVIGFNVLLHPDPHWGSLDGIPPSALGLGGLCGLAGAWLFALLNPVRIRRSGALRGTIAVLLFAGIATAASLLWLFRENPFNLITLIVAVIAAFGCLLCAFTIRSRGHEA